MKAIATILFILFSFLGKAQLKDGIYKSSKKSYRENYFLVVENSTVTLFGWEISMKNDTIYYRSKAKLGSNNTLHFKVFEFSGNPTTEMNLQAFTPDEKTGLSSIILHNWMNIEKVVGKTIYVIATKDIYDSRADDFQFELIGN
ncbi:MAG: hypothetical protein QM737_21920 [Ferruginibacter sp.]